MKPHFVAKEGSVAVKIYRESRKDGLFNYRVTWNCAGRQRQSFADERAAKEFARERARSLAALGSATLTLSGDETRAYRQAVNAAERRGLSLESAFSEWLTARDRLDGQGTLAAAVTAYLDGRRTLAVQPLVSECVVACLAAKRAAGRSERYLGDLASRLNRFADSFHCPLAGVSVPLVEAWLGGLPGLWARSRRNYRQAIAALAAFATRKGWLPKGSLDFSVLESEAEPLGEVTIFTPAELSALIAVCRPRLRPFILLGAWAGIRHAELARMTWAEVNFSPTDPTMPHGWVEVKAGQSKNARKLRARARRLVPLTAGLHAALLPLRGEPAAPIVPFTHISKQLGNLARKAGVTWANNALRHSYASYRLAAVQDAAKVAYELGNSVGMVFAHYRALVTPADAERWFGLGLSKT